MSSNKDMPVGQVSNGANELINELNEMCGVYATELRNIRLGKPLDEDSVGVIADEAAFKMFMELLKQVEKVKDLSKITNIKPEETTETIDEPNKIRGIQDFALNKKKIG